MTDTNDEARHAEKMAKKKAARDNKSRDTEMAQAAWAKAKELILDEANKMRQGRADRGGGFGHGDGVGEASVPLGDQGADRR